MSASPATGATPRSELTVRGLILGAVITFVFTAANVFFGLKAGLTFTSSIPAAVISMAVLRYFRNVTVQENNVVQTVASAAGTLSSIIFVLPGLVMVGWWSGFPYWVSFWICALGGILGVMYSIPLRRALVTNSDLPYPEGVACAEVLKVGVGAEGEGAEKAAEAGRAGLLTLVVGSVASAVFYLIAQTQIFAQDFVDYFRIRGTNAVTGYDFGLSMALFGVGHLVGLSVGIAMLVGSLITWGWLMPQLSLVHPATVAAADVAADVWRHQARFVGAGTIGIASVWTLIKLVKPVLSGLASAMAASRVRKAGQGASLPRTEQDIPIGWVGLITLACLGPIAWLLGQFAEAGGIGEHAWSLALGGVVFVVVMSFLVSAVCGYMAGLIGSSNSPLSGIGILAVIGASLLLVFWVKPLLGGNAGPALVAFALFVTAVVFAVATIANNNLQDLKTGQLVDATPWKQQVALIIGVIAGALVIPPVLDLLNKAYGFAGVPGADPKNALAAPQAALISSLAKGVIEGQLDWSLILWGIGIGVGVIALDAVLAATSKLRCPPLAVGLGMYLPLVVTLMIVVGSVVGWAYDRRASRKPDAESAKQLGVLLASGLIVGESLVGVIVAGVVAFSPHGNTAPLALVSDEFANGIGQWIGAGAFAIVIAVLYRWLEGLAARSRGLVP
ncbi:MAG TPA: oligopeptide transporter, OPT family [Nevskia sp.]|nr:oligopeptide transporter, OPT family [Nevskia sp.]